MEPIKTQLSQGYKRYWRRRRYERLGGKRSHPKWQSRFWRVRITRKLKLKLKWLSPMKLLIRLRDCYVNIMMRLAASPVVASGGFGQGVVRFGTRPVKEYDEKVLIEIYKVILAMRSQAQLVSTDGSSQIGR